MRILKDFTKDAVVYGLGKAIKKFISFLLLPFYTRALSPSEYGILESLGAFVLFVSTFFNLGLDTASWFYFFQPKEQEEKGKILFTTFTFRILTIIPCIIMSFFSREISIYLFESDSYTNVVFVTCMIIPVNILTSEQEHIYRFYRKPWRYNLLTIIKTLGNLVLGILLVVNLRWGVYGAQIASLFSGIIVIIFSYFFYTRRKYTYKFSFYWAKKMLKYGYPLAITGIAVWLYSLSDRILLLKYKDALQVGYYSIGSTFSNPLALLCMAVQMSAGVLFFEVYNKEQDLNKPESKKAIRDMVKLFSIVALFITAFLSVFAYEIVSIVTTKAYLPGITVIPILLFTMILTQIKETIGVGISISEKTFYFTIIAFVSAFINIGLNLILIPKFSYYGSALATLITSIINLVYTYFVSQIYFEVNYQVAKTLLTFSIFFLSIFLIPLLEINFSVKVSLVLKILIFLFLILVPFLTGFIKYSFLKEKIHSIYIKKN